jgi:signal recognition particle receptor subunit alpha
VFVAVYQKSLSLLYVEELLSLVKEEFVALYSPSTTDYSSFKLPFDRLLRECEARADKAKRGEPLSKKPQAAAVAKTSGAAAVAKQPTGAARQSGGSAPSRASAAAYAAAADSDTSDSDGAGGGANGGATTGASEDDGAAASTGAFDVSKLKGALPRGARGRGGAASAAPKKSEKKEVEPRDKKKAARNWDAMGGGRSTGPTQTAEALDRSDAMPAAGGGGGPGGGE